MILFNKIKNISKNVQVVEVKEFTELEMEDGSVVTAVGRLVEIAERLFFY